MHFERTERLNLSQRYALLSLAILFFLLYASISLVNHYYFRTFAYDLAYFNQAIFDYSQFRLADYTLVASPIKYTLGDHFEPIMILIAPLRYLFGNWTLLIVQIAAILFGGYGAFVFTRHRARQDWMAHAAFFHFCSIFGIYSALSFDYHNNVIGAMFLPWIVHFFGKEDFKKGALCFLLLLFSKENMALWGVFIGLGLALMHWKNSRIRWWALGSMGFSALYFVVVMKVIMPALQPGDYEYLHFRYSQLGGNLTEAFKTILTRPLYALELLFTNHFPERPDLNWLKMDFYLWSALSGGIALLLRPQYLLMLLPILAQKMYSDKTGTWGIDSHYSIEAVPLIHLALFSFLLRFPPVKWRLWLAGSLALFTLIVNFVSFSQRHPGHGHAGNLNIFTREHWSAPEAVEVEDVREMLDLIPPGVPVSASYTLLPHLSMRDTGYMFPRFEDAHYTAVLLTPKVFNGDVETWRIQIGRMLDIDWEMAYEKGNLVLLRRTSVDQD